MFFRFCFKIPNIKIIKLIPKVIAMEEYLNKISSKNVIWLKSVNIRARPIIIDNIEYEVCL